MLQNMGNRLFLLICGGWFTASNQLSQRTHRPSAGRRRTTAQRLTEFTCKHGLDTSVPQKGLLLAHVLSRRKACGYRTPSGLQG